MLIEESFVREFEKLFVHYQEALKVAPQGTMAAPSWQDAPAAEQERMVAAARLALIELESAAHPNEDRRRYFAKPGEAEWGC